MTARLACLPAIVVLATGIAVAALRAQQPAPVDAQLIEADRLVGELRHDEAAPLYEAALVEARATGRDAQAAHALVGRAAVRLRRRSLDDARADAAEAVSIAERLSDADGVARATLVLSRIEGAAGKADEARALAERAWSMFAVTGNRRGEAQAAYRRLELGRGDIASVRSWAERSAEASRAAGDVDLEARALHQLGDALFTAELYEEALATLVRARDLYARIGATIDLGTVHNSIGRVYRAHGRLDEALREQKLALELHKSGDDPTARYARLQSLNAVAVVYQALGDLPNARAHLEQALALGATVDQARARDFLQANMASLLADLGHFDQATASLEAVIARGADAFPSLRYSQLSWMYNQMGRADEALRAAERSIAICTLLRECISAYNARSEAYARLGNRPAALADLKATLDRLEELRGQLVPSDFFKRDFLRQYERAYTSAIGLHLAEGEPWLALEAAEQARARAFLDLLASRSPALDGASPDVALTLRGPGPALQADRRSASSPPASVHELIATARRVKSTLVAYWVGSDETFAWVVSPTGTVQSHRIAVSRTTLARLVRDTMPFGDASGAARPEPAIVTRGAIPLTLRSGGAAWRELYTLLIAPIRQALPATAGALLTIVPHDVLSSLSFAALRGPRGRYLLEDFTLHYAPAGGMFAFTAARRQPASRSGPALLVADPVPSRPSTLDAVLPRLPGARLEIAAIAARFRAGQAAALIDVSATESLGRARARARGVLHFATHAVVRDDDPFQSYLALGRSGPDGSSDGILTADEIYGLRLQADLVVLSACRSAAGAVAGDGIATFARAFLYAGTATLVASLWDVADEPTNRLVPSFYRAWLAGADKATALRQAQLRLLADLRSGTVQVSTPLGPVPVPEHPVFWAGFALFGEPR